MGKLLFEEESYNIQGAIFEVYKELGNGFLEAVYQEALEIEFTKRNIPFKSQNKIEINYKGVILKQTYIPDFICYDKIIIEIKAVQTLLKEHEAQLHNYLKATNMKVGFLVNFNHYPQVDIRRIVK